MGKLTSYCIAVMFSLLLHVGLGVFIVNRWEPEQKRQIVAPSYIDARLLELKEKSKPKEKKRPAQTGNEAARKKKEAERRRREAEKRRRAEAEKKAAAEKRRRAEVEQKRRREAERKRQAEAEKKRRQELKRKQLEDDLFADLDAERELQLAESDEQLANSYSRVIRRRVAGNWSRPKSARRDMEAEVLIQLVPTGQVIGVTVVKSSGNAAFDRSVAQAVRKAGGFPELKNLDSRLFDQYFRNLRLVFRPEDLRL